MCLNEEERKFIDNYAESYFKLLREILEKDYEKNWNDVFSKLAQETKIKIAADLEAHLVGSQIIHFSIHGEIDRTKDEKRQEVYDKVREKFKEFKREYE